MTPATSALRRRVLPGLALGVAVALTSCARSRPATRPAESPGRLVYSVGGLSFEAPAAWPAEGDARSVKLSAPDGAAVLEASAAPSAVAEAACLADAERSLRRGAEGLSRVQRHASTFAGRKAVAQEGDAGGWHGWAWATCAGGSQYRLFYAARSPLDRERLDVQRRIVDTARIDPGTTAGGARP